MIKVAENEVLYFDLMGHAIEIARVSEGTLNYEKLKYYILEISEQAEMDFVTTRLQHIRFDHR